MDVTKETLQYAVELAKPNVLEIGGRQYVDKDLKMICQDLCVPTLKLSTLSSLCDYLLAQPDMTGYPLIIHVESPTEVRLYSALNNDRKRENLISVSAILPDISFGKFMDREEFNIYMQSKFVADGAGSDYAAVLSYVGMVESGTITQYGDDGVSQRAVVKTGLNKEDRLIPNPVTLRPYRTFVEVEQPASKFIFRMRDAGCVEAALFESDGKRWRNEAMHNIREYLEDQLQSMIDAEELLILS